MLRFTFLLIGLFMSLAQLSAQGKVIIEGYVYEENDRGFIGDAEVKLFTNQMISVSKTLTDEYGHFVFETTDDRQYIVRANKKLYFQKELKVNPADKNDADKVFLKMEMEREPGYIFDVTLAEPRPAPDAPTNSVDEATIEIYNNTTKKMVWVSEKHPSPYFKFTFQQGNHYTIMISKKRYITKQIEAYVNVHGCIVCIEGVDNVKPGVVDNLTAGHQKGTLLANIELRPIKIGEKIPIDNLYYKSGSFSVKKEMHKTLDELIVLMENNPSLIVELRSHTDCRGDAKFNQNLSLKRANAAVNYILKHSDIDKYRIKAVGMGESNPVKKCKSCKTCSDNVLAMNRRTELVITGLLAQKEKERLPLTKKMEEVRMSELLEEVLGGEQIQIPEGGEMPEELKKQIEADEQAESTGNQTTETVVTKSESPIKVEVQKQEAVIPVPAKDAQKEMVIPVKDVQKEIVVPKQKAVEKKKETIKLEPIDVGKTPEMPKKKVIVKQPSKDDIDKEKALEAARMRAEKAFEGKPSVVQDPGVSDLTTTSEHFGGEIKAEEEVEKPKEPKKRILNEVNLGDMDISRKVATVAKDYTGYKIELKRTRYELPMSDIIFTSYSDVSLYRNPNGDYVYLTGDFATRTIADIGLKYVRKEMPKAKLHLFRKGKMVD